MEYIDNTANKFITKSYLESYNSELCKQIVKAIYVTNQKSIQESTDVNKYIIEEDRVLKFQHRPIEEGEYGSLIFIDDGQTTTFNNALKTNSSITASSITNTTLTGCHSEDTSFEFIISGIIGANNQIALTDGITFDDIMRAYQNKQLMLNVRNRENTLNYVSSNYIYKDDGWNFGENIHSDGGALIFTISNSIKNASIEMIVIGNVNGDTICYLYDYTLSNEMRIYLEMGDYNDPTSLKSITIKRDNLRDEYYDASDLAAGAKSIHNMIFNFKYVPHIYITDISIPDINIYTQDCKYFYESTYKYVFVTYGIYDGTRYKDLTIEMPI